MLRNKIVLVLFLSLAFLSSPTSGVALTPQAEADGERYEYRLLATKKTSTMQKEMNQAADAGYRFVAVMGGATSFGGSELVVIMGRPAGSRDPSPYEYKLLATSKTSTMQMEMNEAVEAGFEYRMQTVSKTSFGGQEVVVILERGSEREAATSGQYEYKLLATKKTSTMQKEVNQVADRGFVLVGLTVSKTKFGGTELVTIMRRSAVH